MQVDPALSDHRVSLTDDPLAYLGILVDCVEEWDRYYVFKQPGRFPLQATDVRLRFNRKVVISYGDKSRASRVMKELDQALTDWRALLRVE
jgi:hypothetical protein